MMHIEFVYSMSTYFNSALSRMMRTIDEVNLKINLTVHLSVHVLTCCLLECRLVSCVASVLVFGFGLVLCFFFHYMLIVGLSGEWSSHMLSLDPLIVKC